MTYEDACELVLSRTDAKAEIERHDANWSEFLEDCGDSETYTGQVILDWLGY